MKKLFYLVSVILVFFGCATSPREHDPAMDQNENLLGIKEILCDYKKDVMLDLTGDGDFEIKRESVLLEGVDGWRLIINIEPGAETALITQYSLPVEDEDTSETFKAKVYTMEDSISLLVDVEESAIALITVFGDEINSGYGSIIYVSGHFLGPLTWVIGGSCKAEPDPDNGPLGG